VLLDLKEECEKYGEVREVVVPRPAEPKMAEQLMGTGNFGKVCGDDISLDGGSSVLRSLLSQPQPKTSLQGLLLGAVCPVRIETSSCIFVCGRAVLPAPNRQLGTTLHWHQLLLVVAQHLLKIKPEVWWAAIDREQRKAYNLLASAPLVHLVPLVS